MLLPKRIGKSHPLRGKSRWKVVLEAQMGNIMREVLFLTMKRKKMTPLL